MKKKDTIEIKEFPWDQDVDEPKEYIEDSPARKKKKRKKKRYFLRFLIFSAIVAGVIVFISSSFFDVSKITVEGNSNYKAEDVIKMSKIKEGTNIFKVKTSKAKKNLLNESYVKSIKIKRKFPDEIVLVITERQEIASIPYGDAFLVIDKNGYILRKTNEEPKLTMLLGLTVTSMDEGKKVGVKETKVLEDTLSMLKTMAYSDLFFKKIDMSKVTIKAYIYDELVCKGTPENILTNMKNGNLERILYDLYQKGITRGTVNIGADEYCSFSPTIE